MLATVKTCNLKGPSARNNILTKAATLPPTSQYLVAWMRCMVQGTYIYIYIYTHAYMWLCIFIYVYIYIF